MDLDIKISVIIPAYNVAQWLERCVNSVLDQTHSNLEVLLIDDGSTDATAQIADRLAEKDARITVVHQENAGLVAVRETGIALAAGDYVSFVDGDDVIEPDFLARLLANAVKYDADISHCGMKYCFYDGRVKLHYGTGEVILYDNPTGVRELLDGRKLEPSLCNKLYRRELLKDSCLDLSVVNNEDLLRNYVLFSRAERSVFEDFCGYQYWRRAESMSNGAFRVEACRHVLRARFLIMEHAGPAVIATARKSYINALIGGYNAASGKQSEEAKEIADHCRMELKRLKKELQALPRGLYLRAAAILYAPGLYRTFYRTHRWKIRFRILKERMQARSRKKAAE